VLPVAGETVGIVGTDEFGPAVLGLADTLGSGTSSGGLTPRLLI
jgi:hypothetical protein